MRILHFLTLGIGLIGVSIIVWGVLSSLIEFIVVESNRLKGVDKCRNREIVRHHLGSYLLLGLEFLIAADIVNTIVKPSLNEIIVLGAIVAIRTVLNFSLNRELSGRGHDSN
ncbi:MAG: DUF1622 domain-containing protein [Candidatus Aureabacteria bacterium]|nr:DUF1622 domain-containing protein [Candidatus Auribacterota bacterium]